MNSLKLSTYFEVVKPNYYYYKLTPLKSLRNYNSDKIISTVSNLYKTLTQRIIRDNKKYFFSVPVKLSYYIFMEKQNVEFYFILPVDYDSLLKDKIMETWNGITIEKVTSIPLFGDKTLKFNMTYTKNDAFSLTTDKRNNVLLSSLMNTMHVMEQGDKVGIIYNFIPCSQSYWKADCISVLNKFKEGYPVEHEVTNVMYGVKLMSKFVMTVLEIVCETVSDLLGTQLKVPNLLMNTSELSNETRKKSDSRVVGTQIVLLSESENLQRANNNGLALSEAFKSINGDNELVFK
jgi:hypothetical protein